MHSRWVRASAVARTPSRISPQLGVRAGVVRIGGQGVAEGRLGAFEVALRGEHAAQAEEGLRVAGYTASAALNSATASSCLPSRSARLASSNVSTARATRALGCQPPGRRKLVRRHHRLSDRSRAKSTSWSQDPWRQRGSSSPNSHQTPRPKASAPPDRAVDPAAGTVLRRGHRLRSSLDPPNRLPCMDVFDRLRRTRESF